MRLHNLHGTGPNWLDSTEVLIGRLEVLLDQRDKLPRQLTDALGDLDVARSRIEQLERLSESSSSSVLEPRARI